MEHSNELARPLDPFTFGKGPLERVLASILNESNDRHLTHKVSGLLSLYQITLKGVGQIDDPRTFEYTLRLVRDDFLQKADIISPSGPLHSHIRNFIIARHRNLLRSRARS